MDQRFFDQSFLWMTYQNDNPLIIVRKVIFITFYFWKVTNMRRLRR